MVIQTVLEDASLCILSLKIEIELLAPDTPLIVLLHTNTSQHISPLDTSIYLLIMRLT